MGIRVLGFDAETTGLSPKEDRITEVGVALWDVENKQPLVTLGTFLYDESYPPLTAEITKLTGITDDMLKEFGVSPLTQWMWLEKFCDKHRVDYIVAHNGENFDRPFLYAELDRAGVSGSFLRSLPWVDTRNDIPFPTEPDSRKLKHLALDCGFINKFEHRAVFDVMTMLSVMSHYDFNEIVEYSQIPFITVRALVNYDNRELAKAQRFSWEKVGDRVYIKQWVKRIKENKFEEEKQKCGFEIVQLKD